jgi:hypothetical protein
MTRWLALLCLSMTLLGCGQDKSVKKGTNEGLKIEGTLAKGALSPEFEKTKSKVGLGAKTDGGKTGK